MSWWVQRKGKDGRYHQWAIDIDPLLLVTVMGVIASILGPAILRDPASALLVLVSIPFVAGFLCLLVAKVSLYRRGIWWSWGPSQMSKAVRRLYIVAYCLLGMGALVLVRFMYG